MQASQITRTTIDNVNWTPIVAPGHCDYVALYVESGAAVKLRTTQSDPNTEKQLGTSLQETLATTPARFSKPVRFLSGDVAYYAQANSATEVIVATWSGFQEQI